MRRSFIVASAWWLLCTPVAAGATDVIVVRRGWHVDVGLARGDIQAPLQALVQQFPQAQYFFFGFGDRHYLLTRKHGTSTLSGALWPGEGVVLLTAIAGTPQQAFGAQHVRTLSGSVAQSLLLQQYVLASLATQANGGAQPLQAGPYPGSLYYAARWRYSALHTCNTWAAESLRLGGFPLHSRGVLFAGQLWREVGGLAHVK